MKKLTGKSVYPGIAIGPAYKLGDKPSVEKRSITDTFAECQRLINAISDVKYDLTLLSKDKSLPGADIFEVHAMLLDDEELVNAMTDKINTEKANAEYAVFAAGETFAEMFLAMDDEYLSARAADIRDVAQRIICKLSGCDGKGNIDVPSILIAEELMPSDFAALDKEKLLGVVTSRGSITAHSAILLCTYGIPAVFNTDCVLSEITAGETVVVDAAKGIVITDANEDEISLYKNKLDDELKAKETLNALKGLPDETNSGRKTKLYANIGTPDELALALENDAKGIGLFRSEFLYMDCPNPPTEDEQYHAYKKVLEGMGQKEVIIRTMDIGADKKVDCLTLPHEENPALGKRAIRICLDDTELFRTQLRALLRSAVHGNLLIMYPMITSVQEIKDIKEQVKIAADELAKRGEPHRIPKQGIMIETPAAAITSDLLAKEVDFFSIGTNDLTQYTLALDRTGVGLDRFYNPTHEAVLRLIKMTADNAHSNGIVCGICGELGSAPSLIKTFIDWGIDELSMSPSKILPTRKIIREME